MPATTATRCFQVFRQTTGAMYAGMAPIESTKTVRGELPDLLAILMLQRCLSSFEAISHLARNGKLNEAMMLGRPLFEESVLLQHVAPKSAEKRNARIVWHQHSSWSAWIDTLQQLTAEELHGRNPAELIDDARREIAVLDSYCVEHGHTKPPSELRYRETAHGLGRSRERIAYDLSNQLFLARGVAIVGRAKHVTGGEFSLSLRDDGSDALLPLLTFWSASSALHSLVAVSTVLKWQLPEQVDEILKYLQRIKLFD